jgi:hypothetical protein
MEQVLTQPTTKSYHRLNVYDYVNEFCGWPAFYELNKYAKNPTQERYLLGLEKTGGRAGEVLALDTANFDLDKRKKIFTITGMRLEKRFTTIKQADGSKTRQHVEAIRKPFPIPLKEPLSRELGESLLECEGPLFQSPYKKGKPLTVVWGYQIIRQIDKELPPTLKTQLGLNQPFRDKTTGQTLADTIHLWQHYFRAERASQLRAEYGFNEADLMEFFGWLDYKTALHYSRIGAAKLAQKMFRGIKQNISTN